LHERYYDGLMTDQPLEPDEPTTVVSSPAPADERAEGGEPSSAPPFEQRGLRRSGDDRVIAGVCGGLGKYLGVDPVLIRIAAVILIFAGGAGIVLYIIGWIAIPEELEEGAAVAPASTAEPSERTRGAIVLGFVFVVLGVFFLLDELWPDFLSWHYVWPVALIAVGLAILLRGRR
jgi:phage shock protein C